MRWIKLAKEILMKTAYNRLLFLLLSMAKCELWLWYLDSINRNRSKLSFWEMWRSCVLQTSFYLHNELNSVTAFSARHDLLLHLFPLPPNPCKSLFGWKSRSLFWFSACTFLTGVRRSAFMLFFCSQMGLLCGRSWFLSSKWWRHFD